MKIDGRTITDTILNNLVQEVDKLKERGVTPALTVILMRIMDKSDTIAAATCLTK